MKIKKLMTKERLLTFAAFIFLGLSGLFIGMNVEKVKAKFEEKRVQKLAEKNKKEIEAIAVAVLPKEGFTLPISWGNIGPQLVKLGVIDQKKFEDVLVLTDEQKEILTKGKDASMKIDMGSGQFVVDMLWALGLAQKSVVYNEGPLGKEYKKEAGNFASTGGWTLAKGDAVRYLNKFDLIPLNPDQQKKVGEIAKNIYRPCCGNSTWFPDCNHGMAALAAIELMVSKGVPDDEIYKNVLKLNSFWFPDTYLTNAIYEKNQGISWDKIDAKEMLSEKFSSAQGAADIVKKIGPLPTNEVVGGSCGT